MGYFFSGQVFEPLTGSLTVRQSPSLCGLLIENRWRFEVGLYAATVSLRHCSFPFSLSAQSSIQVHGVFLSLPLTSTLLSSLNREMEMSIPTRIDPECGSDVARDLSNANELHFRG